MTNYTKEQLAEILDNNSDLGIDKPTIAALNAVDAKSDRVKVSTRLIRPLAQKEATGGQNKRHTIIKMQYPGCVITENHYLGRNGHHSYMKPEAQEWKNDLIWEIKRCGIQDWQSPLKVTISGTFKNLRETADLQNMKIIFDSVQEATGLNDKFFRTETTGPEINPKESPFILIRIEEV